ncbi:hypothetical protein GJAV_G00011090 [Gymnothorax javanicus]|nr:hypothetical protein GJAV_G00011090 [Gymnothorax javanicus]
MDRSRASHSNHLDYNMDSKHGKFLPGNDDRLDSGLDSMPEGEEAYNSILTEMERLNVVSTDLKEYDNEPWKLERTEDGDTLLHLAIIHEAEGYANQMIKRSGMIRFSTYRTTRDRLPFTWLSSQSSLRYVLTQACTEQLPSILASTNYSGHNCLHLVSIQGFLSMVERLIDLGADINAQEQCNGRSPLHLAVDLQNLELVQLLVAKGANVNSLSYGGYTPYHLTYGRQNCEIQEHLYPLTDDQLRELPDSEPEDSEEESTSDDDMMYDDFLWMGQK